MKIDIIKLHNFRNIEECSLNLSEGINIVYGKNASGKTNLLEAIFYFAAGKSFRGCKERDMVKFGEDFASAEMEYESNIGRTSTEIIISKTGTKSFIRNGVKATKLSEYLGMFRAVVFTPDHLELVKGSPENRRRFIDLAICQSFPRYVASLNEYNKILVQKNALLKGNFDIEIKKKLIEVYNEKMAPLAAIITINRSKYIKKLCETASVSHSEMSNGKEELSLEYFSQTNQIRDNCDAECDIMKIYTELYESKVLTEITRCTSVIGPQKDDITIKINGKNAKSYSSQGQQRTAVIAMKMAESELSKKLTGEYPVILLDDVLSELDDMRRENIIERIENKQVIITGCEGIELGEKIMVSEGKIIGQ